MTAVSTGDAILPGTLSAEDSRSLHVLMIGPRVPPLTGQSIAFEVLFGAFARYGKAEVIDLAERFGRRDRAFSSRRAISVLAQGVRLAFSLTQVDAVYMQIAQSRWGLLRDWLYISMARLARRPVVAHLHGGGYGEFYHAEPPFLRRLVRQALAKVDRIIVLSEALRENFAFMGEEFGKRVRVVPNPCPIATARPKAAPKSEVRVVFLSNLLKEKGYLDCIDAMVHVRRQLPGMTVKLTLAGAPLLGADEYRDARDLEEALRKHIRYSELETCVSIAGVVKGDEKLRLLDDAHIALLPTYYRNEGQPIALIEAMARGVPFVATAWRGIRDFVCRDVGIVVPPRSPLAIAEAIVELIRDRDRYERMSAQAVAVAAEYDEGRHIERMVGVLREVCPVSRSRTTRQ